MIRGALLLALLWGGVARAQSPVTFGFDDAGPGAGPSSSRGRWPRRTPSFGPAASTH